MTQTAKTVSRKVAIALGILCVATLVALNFSVITYYSGMNSKNNQINTLNDQIVSLQTQIASGRANLEYITIIELIQAHLFLK
jgi:hypothetical protein